MSAYLKVIWDKVICSNKHSRKWLKKTIDLTFNIWNERHYKKGDSRLNTFPIIFSGWDGCGANFLKSSKYEGTGIDIDGDELEKPKVSLSEP
ncbi:hypothetical protein LXL04_002957 [Taraxacum kok-saghyz]